MVTNYNIDTSAELQKAIKIQPNVDGSITNVIPTIQPVVDVNPFKIKALNEPAEIITGTRTASGGSNIVTTSATRDFYIIAIAFQMVKDAACDVATTTIGVDGVINGATTRLCSVASLTLTAQSVTEYFYFSHPIKVDRNSLLQHSANTYTAGSMIRVATIYGFFDDSTLG